MNNPSPIERVVMRRVRSIALLRPLISGASLAALVLFFALWGIGREVWVAKVFENAPRGLLGRSLYLAYAFNHTRIVVQALSIATLAALIYLARATARLFVHALAPPLTAR